MSTGPFESMDYFEFLAENDIPLDLALRAERLAQIPKEEFEKLLEEGKKTGELSSPDWILRKWSERQ